MPPTEHKVEQRLRTLNGINDIYELTVDHGFADITFNAAVRWFGIANIYVEPEFRRQGRAKALLAHAAIMAEHMDATLIYASIISRESINAFVAVFGRDAVDIKKEGSYDTGHGSEASLMILKD